ncbi:Cell surface protein [Minicystis rosea]|nr:Cell surface protein [Minicystis rosea]
MGVCGNGIVEAGEACDDGNTVVGDACSDCKLPGTPVWTQTYNGSNGTGDSWLGVKTDPSGNVIVAGVRFVGQSSDAVVAKYDANGNQLWVQTYNGGSNGDDAAYGVTTDAQGNIIAVGYETSPGYDIDNKNIWIRKYDPNGNPLWTKTYVGYDTLSVYDEDDIGYGVATNAAGDVFITTTIGYDGASGDFDILVAKLSGTNGSILWNDVLDTANDDEGSAITVDAAGRVIAAGYTVTSAGGTDMWIRKYQDGGSSNTILWTKTYDDAAHGNDFAFGVTADASNNVVVVGAEPVNGQFDASIRKYDANGNLLWTQRHAGAAGQIDLAAGVACDAAGNIYVGGSEETANATANTWTAKYTPAGAIVWSDVYNGSGNGDDYANGVAVDANGYVYAAGYATEQTEVAWLRKYVP